MFICGRMPRYKRIVINFYAFVHVEEGVRYNVNLHVYILTKTHLAFPTEPLNACLPSLEGLKHSLPHTRVNPFWSDPQGGDSRAGQKCHSGPFLHVIICELCSNLC